MSPEKYAQIRWLRWLALATLLSLVVQFFGGITLMNANPQQFNLAYDGQAEPIFSNPDPALYGFYSLLIFLVLLIFLLTPIFCVVRVVIFIPPHHLALRYILLMLNTFVAAAAVMMLMLAHYAAFFVTEGELYNMLIGLLSIGIYISLIFAGVEHVIFGLWAIQVTSIPKYVSRGTLIPSLLGLAIHMLIWLNRDIHPIRTVLGGAVMATEISVWLVYLWSIQPGTKIFDDNTPTTLANPTALTR